MPAGRKSLRRCAACANPHRGNPALHHVSVGRSSTAEIEARSRVTRDFRQKRRSALAFRRSLNPHMIDEWRRSGLPAAWLHREGPGSEKLMYHWSAVRQTRLDCAQLAAKESLGGVGSIRHVSGVRSPPSDAAVTPQKAATASGLQKGSRWLQYNTRHTTSWASCASSVGTPRFFGVGSLG